MDKAQRAELIRATYRAKAGQLAYKPSGKPATTKDGATGRINCQSFGLATSFRWGRREWLEKPDAKPSGATPTIKRTAREHALTRIAQQLPRKLPRVHLSQ